MTLADEKIRAECCERLARLSSESRARWGRMNAHQMICHLNDSFRVASGERTASPATNFLQRTFVKWVALRTPMKWPRGVPTRPEVEQGVGGTAPLEWELDRAELLGLIWGYGSLSKFGIHPIFGTMTREEWMIWGYRHLDHHLRQFGV